MANVNDKVYDVNKIRSNFPILKETMNDKPLVYLDSSATSLKPQVVMDAIQLYNTKKTANVHRGVYKLGNEATELYESTRDKLATFINSPSSDSIIMTKGATEALNLVAMSYGMTNLKPGDEIITSQLEHHSSFLPWQNVANITGAKLVFVPLTPDGRITVDNFKSVLSDKTKVVALTYISNVMGYITPVKEITSLAHKVGAVVSIDAAQASPHIKIDVTDLDCDFLSFTGHKMLGPSGVGVLYGRYSLLESMPPVHFGGEMIDLVDLEGSTYKNPPYRFEAGTPVIGSTIGLGAAIDYLSNIGFEAIHKHEMDLRAYAIEGLSKIHGVTIYNKNSDIGIITFNMDGVHPHDMASVYDNHGVCVRAGHHCTQLLMRFLKQPATLRASLYLYNTKADVDALVEATKAAKLVFTNNKADNQEEAEKEAQEYDGPTGKNADLPALKSLYKQVIMDHAQNPSNKGLTGLDDTYHSVHLKNPTCGDDVTVAVKIQGDKIADVRQDGEGCFICCSSASIMSETLSKRTIKEADTLVNAFYSLLKSENITQENLEELGDAIVYEGVAKLPARIKCATIPWKAWQQAVEEILKKL